ncbi:hypothetical protein [Desulfovibrio cuneatus]|uniref:hypothetical protein n=1 Tax=Desulfovibrio cuneatus TaxID=159728 RepID=UPI00048953FC|nr:hypothetical protein [Desulfovibrio cuneatus]
MWRSLWLQENLGGIAHNDVFTNQRQEVETRFPHIGSKTAPTAFVIWPCLRYEELVGSFSILPFTDSK